VTDVFLTFITLRGRENEKAFWISDCRFRFYSLQLSLFAGGINYCWLNVVEVVDESTRERGGGQLPKFGAVDEKIGKGFSGRAVIKKKYLVDGFSYAELGLSDRFKFGKETCWS
jgi:hypothetical protein